MTTARLLCGFAIAGWAGGPAPAGAAAPAETAAMEEVVELPPLEVVSPGRPLPPWQYADLGHMEVLSRCSSSLTREFIEAHWRLTQLLRLLLPADLQVKFSAPQIIVLTDQKTTPVAAKEAIQGFGPADGRTAREEKIRFIPNLRLNDTDAVAVYAILNEQVFSGDRLVLTPGHVRDVIERRTPPLPAWFIAGVLTLFKDMNFLPDAIEFAPLDWVSVAETEHLRRDPEYPRTLLPLRDLFAGAGPRDTPEAAATAQLWLAQSALLVRWALEGDDPARRTGFWKFVARTAGDVRAGVPASEAVLRECLGVSYADLRDRLSDLLPGTLRDRLRLRAEKLVPVPPFKLRNATPDEVGRIKGDWERMEITYVKTKHPQYADKYALQAHRTLTEAHGKGARDPRLFGVIGLYESEVGNGMAARGFLEEAARAKVVRPRVYLELARLRYAEAKESPAAGEKRLSAMQANHVLEPLTTAWTQAPPLVDTYLLAAEVWVHSAAVLERSHFALLDEGHRLFPTHIVLTYFSAVLKFMHGDAAGGEALIAQALQTTQTASVRTKFEQLRELFRRPGATPVRP